MTGRRAWWLLVAVSPALVLIVASWQATVAAGRLGRALRQLSDGPGVAFASTDSSNEAKGVAAKRDLRRADGDTPEPSAATVGKAQRRSAKARGASTLGQLGWYVKSAAVLRLANQGASHSGAYVAAGEGQPAGLSLSGVEALGIGLREGDVLTLVAGTPARSVGQVVAHVIAARGRGLTSISGTIWRKTNTGFRQGTVVVEQPYPEREEPRAPEDDCDQREEGPHQPSDGCEPTARQSGATPPSKG
jgi:hypothetical protein